MNEDELDAIGFMFDAEHSKETRTMRFGNDIEITFRMIGDQPGHVQSGQYLWPAASFAGHHLIENWNALKAANVIELGSGCGLTGLVVSKLPGVNSVVFTDYDNGSLELIRGNIDLNRTKDASGQSLSVHYLKWGQAIPNEIKIDHAYPSDGFRLIVGADLLYCIEVVRPLFTTVRELLHSENGLFMLTTSFKLDEVLFLLLSVIQKSL